MNTYYCIIAQHISAHLTEFESRHHDNLWQFVTNVTAEMLVTHSINYFSVNPHLAQKNDLVDVWNTLYITWDFKVARALQEAVWLPDVPIRSHMQRHWLSIDAQWKLELRWAKFFQVFLSWTELGCYSSLDLSSIYTVKYHLTTRICLYQLSFLISMIPGLRSRFPAFSDLPVI